ncbi:MAG TPA: VOC family protein [Nodosilinea sp.]|nr:VOC family protein [Nodosilinea sp.]
MAFELDHIFICTARDAPAADQLIQVGLVEGRSNRHAGQGTANRCFFFHNLMLELLWVHDAAEAQSPRTRPTYLWERWSGQAEGNCPFGVCLRPTAGPAPEALPFPTWDYQPAYLPAGVTIPVATNVSVLREPMLFYLPFAQRQDSYPEAKAQPLNHGAGWREATRVSLTLPPSPPRSEALEALAATGLVSIQTGPAYLMELGFDGEGQGQHHDFRPALPLIIHW